MPSAKKFLRVMLIPITVLTAFPPAAHAWGKGHHQAYPHHDRYPYGRVSLSLPHASLSIGYGGHKYLYSRGIFYAPGVREYVVVPPPAGVLVSSIPDGHDQVIVDGVSYYVYNGVYYSRVTQGYRVTAPPPAVIVDTATVAASAPVAVSPAAKAPQAFTVNIPGPGAGYTTVIVKRSGQGFTGPQGEYYPEFPAVAQLQAMYVK